jgi:hypothetical protein
MNTKKVFSTSLILALALLIALGAIVQPAAAGRLSRFRLEKGGTIELGKQGLAVSNIPHGVSHVLAGPAEKPLPPRFNHKLDISYRAPVMEVRFLNQNGGTIDNISAQVYVFFNIGKSEVRLWEQGGTAEIAIWYYDERSGGWEYCPTHFVNENLHNGGYDRLTCLAPGSGYYALGQVDFDPESFNPYTYDDLKVEEFKRKYQYY